MQGGLLWTKWRCFALVSHWLVVPVRFSSDLKSLHTIQEELALDGDQQAGAGGEEVGTFG